MYPVLFEVFGLIVPSWHFFFMLAAFAAMLCFKYLQQKYAPWVLENKSSNFIIIVYVSSYLGSRLYSIYVDERISDFREVAHALFSLGPMTLYGGVLLSGVSALVYLWHRNEDLPRVLDLLVPSVLIGIAIGRIGCFLNGDDYGVVIEKGSMWSVFAVRFTNHASEEYRLAVQLIESVICILIAFYCLRIIKYSKLRGAGRSGMIGICIYSVARFFLDFVRADSSALGVGYWLSVTQAISICLILCSVLMLVRKHMSTHYN